MQVEKKTNHQDHQYKLAYGKINSKNLELIKLLTRLTLPVTYSDLFYHKLLQYQEFSLLAYFNDILIGNITSREEKFENMNTLYIMTFGVLESYRCLGFGSQILEELTNIAKQRNDIDCLYLHMWIQNQNGYKFYQNHGFEKIRELPDYYTDIEPKGCYILMKKLR